MQRAGANDPAAPTEHRPCPGRGLAQNQGVFNSLTAECRGNDPGPAPADAYRRPGHYVPAGARPEQHQDVQQPRWRGREQDREPGLFCILAGPRPCWPPERSHTREPRPGLHQKPAQGPASSQNLGQIIRLLLHPVWPGVCHTAAHRNRWLHCGSLGF